MKIGDVVLYTAYGHTHPALVLGLNESQPEHLGAHGEPLLHLAFLAPERESAKEQRKIGYEPTVFRDFDVVHSSQTFSAAYQKEHGLNSAAAIAMARGPAAWDVLNIVNVLGNANLDRPRALDVIDSLPPADAGAEKRSGYASETVSSDDAPKE